MEIKGFKMVERFSVFLLLASVLVICVTAELTSEGNIALDSEDDSFNFALDENIAMIEDIRPRRNAKNENRKGTKQGGKKGKKNKPRKSGKSGKRKKNNKNSNGKKSGDRKGGKKGKKNKPRKSGESGNRKKNNKNSNGKKRGDRKSEKKGKRNKNNKISQKKHKNKPNKSEKSKKRKEINKNSQNEKKKGARKSEKKKGGNKNNNPKKEKNKGSKKFKPNKRRNKNKKRIQKGRKNSKKDDTKKARKSKNKENRKSGNKKKKKNKITPDGSRKKKKKKGTRKSKTPKKIKAGSMVNLTCLKDAVTYTKFLKDNVVNFLRRNSRLETQNKLTNKKAGKKGEFKEPAARIIQAGGGDRTNLSCGGSTTSIGAKKMLNITTTLDNCAGAIKNACKPPVANTTMLSECETNGRLFNATITGCIATATRGKDACSCFQADAVKNEKKALENCKGTKQAAAAAKARTACLKVMRSCKDAATTAGTLQYACKYTQADLIKVLKQLSANSIAFKALMEKIKKLTGLEGVLPGSSNRTSSVKQVRSAEQENEEDDFFDSHQARLRGKRQEVNCSSIVTLITTCTTAITNTPASPKVAESCKAPTFTIGTCTDDDKTNIQAALDAALEKNAIIIAFIDSVKSELKETTGSTPSPAEIQPDTTAKAGARSRSILRKMLMEKMQLRN